MPDIAAQRRLMVDSQLRTFDVNDPAVLHAMATVPRELFLPEPLRPLAYSDQALRIGDPADPAAARVMLMPMVLARMIQVAGVAPGARVLDVASGAGYSAAVMARIGARVTALENDPALTAMAKAALTAVEVTGVAPVTGPLEQGWPETSPYDVILVEGAFEVEPKTLLAQLAEGGRLVGIEGAGRSARVMLYTKARGGDVGGRPVFDAGAPVLASFRRPAEFVF
jgi:protein-L-isoaspartate(D-aspartate) O-methyltransferase